MCALATCTSANPFSHRSGSGTFLSTAEPPSVSTHAARQASGFRVAQIAGVEAEMELPFAGVHQLCAPMLDRLDALPAPQQEALRVALGLATGTLPTGS